MPLQGGDPDVRQDALSSVAVTTMIVLAGLAQLRVETGAPVRRGELLGVLGGRPLGAEEYVMYPDSETGADTGETLYIEVRRDRGPIDPEPLFAKDNG